MYDIIETERLITIKEVEKLTGLSRVTLWRRSNNNKDPFPQAYRNGTHYTRWKLSEILSWIDSLRVRPEELAHISSPSSGEHTNDFAH